MNVKNPNSAGGEEDKQTSEQLKVNRTDLGICRVRRENGKCKNG